jgi:AcrR family transcriptional regulator
MPSSAERARRTPIQRRSRERVEGILRAAEQIVVSAGVEALSTRSVAERARVPVATLYQYFADREAIIAALIERHVSAMDERIAADLAALERFSVRTLVETTVAAYVAGYRERPSYVVLWFRGRVSPELVDYVRERNERLAVRFHSFTTEAGILRPGTHPLVLRLTADVIDRFLEVAYRHDLDGDQRIVREGIEMTVSYLERHATPAGIAGVKASDLGQGVGVAGSMTTALRAPRWRSGLLVRGEGELDEPQ